MVSVVAVNIESVAAEESIISIRTCKKQHLVRWHGTEWNVVVHCLIVTVVSVTAARLRAARMYH